MTENISNFFFFLLCTQGVRILNRKLQAASRRGLWPPLPLLAMILFMSSPNTIYYSTSSFPILNMCEPTQFRIATCTHSLFLRWPLFTPIISLIGNEINNKKRRSAGCRSYPHSRSHFFPPFFSCSEFYTLKPSYYSYYYI